MARLFPFFLILLEFAGNISNDMFMPALPEIARTLGITNNSAQLTVSIWFLGGAALLWLIGPLSDRYGRRLMLLTAGGVFCLSCIGCAMAAHIVPLILFRFVQGMAVSAAMIVGYATLNEIYEDEQATTLMGWMGISSIVAPLIGPLIGGAVMLIAPWRAIFWILAVLGALSVGFLARSFPFCAIDTDEHALEFKRLIEIYKSILSNKRFTLSSILYALGFSSTMSWIIVSPAILMVKYGYTPMQYALWQIPVFATFTLGAILTKTFIRRRSRPWVLRFFLAWALCGSVVLTIFSFTEYPPLLVGLVSLTLFARGVTFAPMSRIALSIFTVKRGAATAMFYFIVLGTSGLVTLAYSALPNYFVVLGISLTILSLVSVLVNRARAKTDVPA